MLRFLIVLFLAAPAWCRTPEEVVRTIYSTHLKYDSMDKTLARTADCFTPTFLRLFQRALALPTVRGKISGVDVDLLVFSQGGWGDYEVGRAVVDGPNAVVPVQLWVGVGTRGMGKGPAVRSKVQPHLARVHLTDLGSGFQVYDIEHPANRSGSVTMPALWVRQYLRQIVR